MVGNEGLTICTVVAKNYIAFARTLCNSFLAQHPSGVVYVLIVDEFDGYVQPEREEFVVVSARDLGIERLREMSFKYNVTELSTALKPFFLEYLLEREGIDKVLYLDPDILVTNTLGGLYLALDAAEVIVTPHLDCDYPEDGLRPNDAHIMKSGIFNLGFIGVRRSETTRRFLTWWRSKMYDKCVIDHAAGYFVDQKFIDLSIGLFNGISIIRDTGYNVAYWNLHSRDVSYRDGKWRCNDGPLFFFHFSNYKPERPDEISGHQNRIKLSTRADLQHLFSSYSALLMKNGYPSTSKWPYTYNFFSNGTRIPERVRELYRKGVWGREGDPFDVGQLDVRRRLVVQWIRHGTSVPRIGLRRLVRAVRSRLGRNAQE